MNDLPTERQDGGTIRVLHVDDEAEFAAMVAELLPTVEDTLAVVTEHTVEDAKRRLEADDIDCVVSDYQMPGETGLDLLRAVRERDDALPFVLFTGKGSEEIASEAISEGVSDYLQKTTGPDQFTVLANRIVNLHEGYRARKQFEQLTRRYELIARSATDALWDWAIENGEVDRSDSLWRSDGFERAFGYAGEDVSDELGWWVERVHPEDREDAIAAIDDVLARGEEYYEDRHRFRRADGTYVDVLARGYVVYDAGEPVRMVGALIHQ